MYASPNKPYKYTYIKLLFIALELFDIYFKTDSILVMIRINIKHAEQFLLYHTKKFKIYAPPKKLSSKPNKQSV